MSCGNVPGAGHALELTRLLKASPEAIWRCWTEPKLLVQWFAPRPWRTEKAELDVRPGGSSFVLMRGPEGEEVPCPGVYLAVEPARKLVFTDAFTKAWEPSAKPFFVGTITLSPEEGGTSYTAHAAHWTEEDRAAHERMGFHEGWGQCATQLEEVARGLG